MGFFTEGDIVPPGFPIAKYNTSSKKKRSRHNDGKNGKDRKHNSQSGKI